MKKLRILIGVLFISAVIFAQEDANSLKNEGNNAYREKNYKKAFESYAGAIMLLAEENVIDTPLVYNTGYCAYKSKYYDVALEYFQKSTEYKYKKSKPYQYIVSCNMKLKNLDAAEKAVLDGIVSYPDEKKLKDLAGTVYLNKGIVFYNAGNKIKKAANESGMNETDPETFKAEYAKADEQYKLAMPLVEKAFEYNSENEKIIKALKNVYISLDMNDKAEAL